jgi:beta-galactosidase
MRSPSPGTPPATRTYAVGLDIGGIEVAWATVTPLTQLVSSGGTPMLVAHAHGDLAPQLAVSADCRTTATDAFLLEGRLVINLPTDSSPVAIEAASGGQLLVLVLGPDEALRAWTPTVSGRRLLVLSDVDIIVRQDTLVALAEAAAAVRVLDPLSMTWHETDVEPSEARRVVPAVQTREASEAKPIRRTFGNRASAPRLDEFEALGARYRLDVGPIPSDVDRAILLVDLFGDVAQIRVNGDPEPFEDLFWDGEPWTIDLTGFRGASELTLDLALSACDPNAVVRRTFAADRQVRQLGAVALVRSAELLLTRSFDIPTTATEV